ncbi:tetratricopeptide repeat protein [Dokdonia sp. Hel_I_53]|uniref:tetratricopeptide repeat protein n=1 Tax=Dokdonia sp. Hel_I_53 TaxID=1566287 RepID=UPI001199FE89|nr:tetratricopeptide repeat protein [Dokdonia sp. Hel_I_53]TVZ53226.1 tetratricopeptide repeat protein [Dokdonia sp. Hel_I_53]
MATYNKRGYKPKTKPEKEDVEEFIDDSESTTAEVFGSLDEGANKAEEWFEKNQKPVIGVIIAALVIALLYLGYTKFIVEPNETEAANELVVAQESFTTALESTNTSVKDSLYMVALEGRNGKYGLLDVAENYGSTPSGNLAHYYAGMSYLEIKEYQNAISHLQDFSSDDDILAPLAKGAIGDAFMQLGQAEEAYDYYEDAASISVNTFTTPRFLFKAGITAIDLGNNDAAVKHLSRIKDEFSTSEYASQVDLYLGRAQAGK